MICNQVNLTGIAATAASMAILLLLALVMLGSPGHAAAQDAPTPRAYITVEIVKGDDTVSWYDPDGCTSDYNTYLAFTGIGQTSRTHIGSVASGSTEATQDISSGEVSTLFNVELYCGTYDSSSSQNVLIASTGLTRSFYGLTTGGFKPGFYSSAPLTALSINSGTLSPAFDRGIGSYAIEVPSDVEVVTLTPTVLTGYQTDFVRNPTWGIILACSDGNTECGYHYGDGVTNGIVLSDTDTETAGFQVNLTKGVNRLGIGLNRRSNAHPDPGRLYDLTVTVQNSSATGQPTISGTLTVGQTLTADTSGIVDSDGLTNVTYSYQWLTSRDAEIDGATSSTYTVQLSDNGKVIKVRVTFTDDGGSDESLTSEGTSAAVVGGL